MTEMMDEIPEDLQALADFARNLKPSAVDADGLAKYGPLNPESEGSWAVVTYKGDTIGLIWTDWVNAGGYTSAKTTDVGRSIDTYISDAKKMGWRPGMAFSTFSTYAENHMDGLEVGDVERGILSSVIEMAASIATNGKNEVESTS